MTELIGKVVVAHPAKVAHADQVAAEHQIKSVVLLDYVPLTHAFVLDMDELIGNADYHESEDLT